MRKRRLEEIKAKARQGRKANEHAMVAEFKRQKRPERDPNLERKNWLAAQHKEKEASFFQ